MENIFLRKRWDNLSKQIILKHGDSERLRASLLIAWETIFSKYTEPHRFYHTLDHLQAMFVQANAYPFSKYTTSDDGFNSIAVELAIFFHDIVYETDDSSSENEQRSAILFRELLQDHLPLSLVESVGEFILATKSHRSLSPRKDLNYFLDLDLSILGASREEYRRFAMQIRREYERYPAETFCRERARFMRAMLLSLEGREDGPQVEGQRRGLYHTPEIRRDKEEAARRNIMWECAVLETGTLISEDMS